MAGILERFGQAVGDLARTHPRRARKLLLAGFRAFGLKQRLLPDRRLTPARQYSADLLNQPW